MDRWTGKWDKENFLNFIHENGIKVEIFDSCDNDSTLLIKVFTFEQMNALFGGGRVYWAIAIDRHYWRQYVTDRNRFQYVWLDFSKRESEQFSKVAFTVDCKEGITDAYDSENRSVGHLTEYMKNLLELGIELGNVIELNGIPSTKPSPMPKPKPRVTKDAVKPSVEKTKRKLRIKGTNIYVKALDASSEGISCQYINGDRKGAYSIIAGDCLVEENE